MRSKREEIDIFEISRDILFDRYLPDILRLAITAYANPGKDRGREPDLASISKLTAALIKQVEAQIRDEVAKEHMSYLKNVETAKDIIAGKANVSDKKALEHIIAESNRTGDPVSKVCERIIAVKDIIL